jgi:hypothetical protein
MPPESWLVLTVAAAFLLLGIAGSPLALALLHQRRSRSEQLMERKWRELADQVRALENRQTQYESINLDSPGMRSFTRADSPERRGSGRADCTYEPALIAVPNLEGEPHDRDVTIGGIKERYAAIWALADSGAKPDVIARATGQPIGQIELILGLGRQIDGTRTIFSHAAHAS